MHKIITSLLIVSLAGCSSVAARRDTYDAINTEIAKAASESKARPADSDAVSAALLPPLNIEIPKPKQPLEERFSLAFNAVPAQQFFMAIVTGTRYSMLVHPDVSGTVSANLKDVTVLEALDAIREQYGYDYKIEGTRIHIKPLGMQTRVFQVNYLTGSRKGTSEIRVTSGSINDAGSPAANVAGGATTTVPGGTSYALESSKISTTSSNDFWGELKASLDCHRRQRQGRTQRGRQPAIRRGGGARHVERIARCRCLSESDPSGGGPPGDPGSQDPGSAVE